MKLQRSLLVLLAAAGTVRAAGAPVSRLLPPKTALVFGIRVRPVLDALEAQGVLKEVRQQTAGLLPPAMLSGFDPFKDVDEILLASTGAGQDAPALAVVIGHFHPEKRGVVEASKGSKQVLAFLDDSTLLAGDAA